MLITIICAACSTTPIKNINKEQWQPIVGNICHADFKEWADGGDGMSSLHLRFYSGPKGGSKCDAYLISVEEIMRVSKLTVYRNLSLEKDGVLKEDSGVVFGNFLFKKINGKKIRGIQVSNTFYEIQVRESQSAQMEEAVNAPE